MALSHVYSSCYQLQEGKYWGGVYVHLRGMLFLVGLRPANGEENEGVKKRVRGDGIRDCEFQRPK